MYLRNAPYWSNQSFLFENPVFLSFTVDIQLRVITWWVSCIADGFPRKDWWPGHFGTVRAIMQSLMTNEPARCMNFRGTKRAFGPLKLSNVVKVSIVAICFYYLQYPIINSWLDFSNMTASDYFPLQWNIHSIVYLVSKSKYQTKANLPSFFLSGCPYIF